MISPTDANYESFAGAGRVKPVQVAFPVELTSVWSASTGYSWKRLMLSTVSVVDAAPLQMTGTLAVPIDGNETLPVGTRGWLEPDPSATGWLFISGKTSSGGTPSGADSCGWTVGADTDTCLRMTVVSAQGVCSGIDTTQSIELLWDVTDSRYESGATDFTGTGSGGTGQVTLDVSGASPVATIDGVTGKFMGCSGDGGLVFAFGGATLCGGTAGTCNNYFTVRFDCECCSIAGWGGANKWYCVEGVATYLTEEDRCDTDIVIDSGPYDTEEEAEADCPPSVTICAGTAAERTYPETIYARLSNVTAGPGGLEGLVVPMTYGPLIGTIGVDGWWGCVLIPSTSCYIYLHLHPNCDSDVPLVGGLIESACPGTRTISTTVSYSWGTGGNVLNTQVGYSVLNYCGAFETDTFDLVITET